ncbi:MAG TPA: hypothetical protein VLL28_07200 [Hyphomicrobiaceae bacterium]|nr:hypothetical protein [Hyphomicrobiaceae bacterium]
MHGRYQPTARRSHRCSAVVIVVVIIVGVSVVVIALLAQARGQSGWRW